MERKNQAQGNPVNNIASTFDNNKTRQINWLMELELRKYELIVDFLKGFNFTLLIFYL